MKKPNPFSDDLVLILSDEPGESKATPGEKIAAARERDRERFERRAITTANRRAIIREILLNLRAGLQKSKQWRDLMYMPEFVQLPEDCRWWPIKAAWTVKNLVQLLDEKSWSDSK